MTEFDLHVDEQGNPDGPPTVFIHGFMSSNLQWEPNREALSAELHMLMVEQAGHGGSPGPDDPSAYRATTVLAQLERIRVERGIDRWWMVGQSLGGAISVRYALAHPDRVAGLVFTNSRAVFGITGRQATEAAEGESDRDRPWTRERARRLPYHPGNARRLPPELKDRMAEAADNMSLAVLKHLHRGGPWASTDELDQLAMPVLLVNGRFEKAFQPCVDQAKAAVPDLRVIDLDGGHSVNIDQPEAFDRAVLDFIVG
jgi:pimeloyl-ACP methyl ester carboxylesterase